MINFLANFKNITYIVSCWIKYCISPQDLLLGPGAMDFLINKYWLIARDFEPSTVFLMHIFDPSTVLDTVMLMYAVDSITLL